MQNHHTETLKKNEQLPYDIHKAKINQISSIPIFDSVFLQKYNIT